jgi:lipooligosaccharide transport system permease protein
MTAQAVHLLERKQLWLRHAWPIILSGAIEPLIWQAAAGYGFGRYIGSVDVGGRLVSYTDFVGPGLIAATAMIGAVFDTTIDVLWRLRFSRTYDAILSAPILPRDVALGEISAGALRGTFNAALFLAVLTGFGAVRSWWGLMAIPVGALTALGFAAAGMAFTTYLRSFSAFEWLPTITTMLFLFSATFFPPSALGRAHWVVEFSPLYHAVSLMRSAMAGHLQLADVGHVAVLVAMAAVGLGIASRRLGALLLR